MSILSDRRQGSFENPTPSVIILQGNFLNEFYPE